MGYYRYFVPNYSKIARPLLDLTKKATSWHWGPEQMKVFKTLKTLMCCKPVLAQPNFDKHFYLETDASMYGMGAILSQVAGPNPSTNTTDNPDNNLLHKNSKLKLHLIAYYSATFTPTERNYNIYE
jgi:reverse transcriptase-like protein